MFLIMSSWVILIGMLFGVVSFPLGFTFGFIPNSKTTTLDHRRRLLRNSFSCLRRHPVINHPLRAKEESKRSVEGFGVTEKNIELRDLIESNGEIDLNIPKADMIEPKDTTNLSNSGIKDEANQHSKNLTTLHPMTIMKFMVPTLGLWIASPVMSLIDTSVVGRFCGPTDLAALSPGCTLIDSSSYLFMFIATAATNMVASARADRDDEKSEEIVSEALFLALCSGLFLASIVFVAGKPLLLAIAGQESAIVVPSALKYATIRAFAQPAVVMASVARAASLANKDTKGPLVSVIIAFVVNVIGTTFLVRRTSLGIMGAAIGTLCADVMATMFLLFRIRQPRIRNAARKREAEDKETNRIIPLFQVPTMKNFQLFCKYAAPIFFTILGKSVVYNGVAVTIGRLGAVALAAHQVLLRSFFFWTPVGDSVGMSSQVFLPAIMLKERKTGIVQRGARRSLFITGLLSGLCAATMAGWLPSRGAMFFTKDLAVATALKETAPILGFSILMHAIALTCEGMLLAQRDLRFLSSSYIITTIATIGLLLSSLRPQTLQGYWWLLAGFQISRAVQFAIRTLWTSRYSKEL